MNTEILVITDRSGSMASIQSSAVAGFNAFINEQRSVPGEARVTHVLFDDKYELEYQAKPLSQVPVMTRLGPRGMTALNDAIGRTMDEQGQRIRAEGWAQKVIVVIITDGGENSSRRYTTSTIHSMISHAQEHGWAFVFVAANQDAFATGAALGIARDHTYNFAANAAGTQSAYATMSAATRSLRGTTF